MFKDAHASMLEYFKGCSALEKATHRIIVPELHGGTALLGFNTPSPAKELFRYRHGHSMQPCSPATFVYVAGSVRSIAQVHF